MLKPFLGLFKQDHYSLTRHDNVSGFGLGWRPISNDVCSILSGMFDSALINEFVSESIVILHEWNISCAL